VLAAEMTSFYRAITITVHSYSSTDCINKLERQQFPDSETYKKGVTRTKKMRVSGEESSWTKISTRWVT